MSRKCEYCDGVIPESKHRNIKYCSITCCDRAQYRRREVRLFENGWNAAMEAATKTVKKKFVSSSLLDSLCREMLELKPPKVKINART